MLHYFLVVKIFFNPKPIGKISYYSVKLVKYRTGTSFVIDLKYNCLFYTNQFCDEIEKEEINLLVIYYFIREFLNLFVITVTFIVLNIIASKI